MNNPAIYIVLAFIALGLYVTFKGHKKHDPNRKFKPDNDSIESHDNIDDV